MKRIPFVVFVLLLILATGCVSYDDLTMVSSKNVLAGMDKNQSHGTFSGKSSRWMILFIPCGLPSIKEATDDALAKGNGNLISNAELYDTIAWIIPLVIARQGFEVKGEIYQVSQPIHFPVAVESTETMTRHKTEREGR